MRPNRSKPLALALVVLLLVSAISMVGAAQQSPTAQNNQSVSPGERLSGVVGVQNAEITGDLENRTFGIKVAQAASNESRADVAKTKLDELDHRLSTLHDRKQALNQARENGTISNGTYNARIAVLAAETANVKQQLNATENATSGLPEELLASKGINVDAIQTLKHNASNLTGPEVAAIARSIAGPEVGKSIAQNRTPVDIGPPTNVGPANNNSNRPGDVNDTDPGQPDDTPGSDNQPDDSDNTNGDGDDQADADDTDKSDRGNGNSPS